MKKLSPQKKAFLKNLETTKAFDTSVKLSHETKTSILAIDYGESKSGLAWSPDGVCAIPLEVVLTKDLLKKIQDLITQKNIKRLLFGLPISGDGQEQGLCLEIRTFAKNFASLKTHFINERSSSQAVLLPKNLSRIDDLAAAQILEYFLASQFLISPSLPRRGQGRFTFDA